MGQDTKIIFPAPVSSGGTATTIAAYGSLPSAPAAGDLVFADQTGNSILRWSGSAWIPVGISIYNTPDLGDFTQLAGGGAPQNTYNGTWASDERDGIIITGKGAPALHTAYVSVDSSADWTVTALIDGTTLNGTGTCGIVTRESAGGKALSFSQHPSSGALFLRWNSLTSFATSGSATNARPGRLWMRMFWDVSAATFTCGVSTHPTQGYQDVTETLATFLTTAPDQVGVYINSNSTTSFAGMRCLSWTLTV